MAHQSGSRAVARFFAVQRGRDAAGIVVWCNFGATGEGGEGMVKWF